MAGMGIAAALWLGLASAATGGGGVVLQSSWFPRFPLINGDDAGARLTCLGGQGFAQPGKLRIGADILGCGTPGAGTLAGGLQVGAQSRGVVYFGAHAGLGVGGVGVSAYGADFSQIYAYARPTASVGLRLGKVGLEGSLFASFPLPIVTQADGRSLGFGAAALPSFGSQISVMFGKFSERKATVVAAASPPPPPPPGATRTATDASDPAPTARRGAPAPIQPGRLSNAGRTAPGGSSYQDDRPMAVPAGGGWGAPPPPPARWAPESGGEAHPGPSRGGWEAPIAAPIQELPASSPVAPAWPEPPVEASPALDLGIAAPSWPEAPAEASPALDPGIAAPAWAEPAPMAVAPEGEPAPSAPSFEAPSEPAPPEASWAPESGAASETTFEPAPAWTEPAPFAGPGADERPAADPDAPYGPRHGAGWLFAPSDSAPIAPAAVPERAVATPSFEAPPPTSWASPPVAPPPEPAFVPVAPPPVVEAAPVLAPEPPPAPEFVPDDDFQGVPEGAIEEFDI
jgi:hypothetical protein